MKHCLNKIPLRLMFRVVGQVGALKSSPKVGTVHVNLLPPHFLLYMTPTSTQHTLPSPAVST